MAEVRELLVLVLSELTVDIRYRSSVTNLLVSARKPVIHWN
jgi:hypothetical protein